MPPHACWPLGTSFLNLFGNTNTRSKPHHFILKCYFSVSDHHLLCLINQVSDRLSVCDFVKDTDSINNYNPVRDVYGMCPLAASLAYANNGCIYNIFIPGQAI